MGSRKPAEPLISWADHERRETCTYLVAGAHFVGRYVRDLRRGTSDTEAVSRSDGSKTNSWSIDGAAQSDAIWRSCGSDRLDVEVGGETTGEKGGHGKSR